MLHGTSYSRLSTFKSWRVTNDRHKELAYLWTSVGVSKGPAPIGARKGLGGLAGIGPSDPFGAAWEEFFGVIKGKKEGYKYHK